MFSSIEFATVYNLQKAVVLDTNIKKKITILLTIGSISNVLYRTDVITFLEGSTVLMTLSGLEDSEVVDVSVEFIGVPMLWNLLTGYSGEYKMFKCVPSNGFGVSALVAS